MAHRRPYVFMIVERKPYPPYKAEDTKTKTFPTYRELVKNLKDLLKESEEEIVTVYRQRRGEWGEWFEKWGLLDGKPVKLKEGWM